MITDFNGLYINLPETTPECPYTVLFETDTYCIASYDPTNFEDYCLFHILIMINLILKDFKNKEIKSAPKKVLLSEYLTYLGYSEQDFILAMQKSFESEPKMNIRAYEPPKELTELALTVKEKSEFWAANNNLASFIEPILFQNKVLEPTPSCAIVDMVYSVCVGKNLRWLTIEKELSAKKPFAGNLVELIIKEASEEILAEYGYDTLAIMQILLTYAYSNKRGTDTFITVSGADILKLLNKEEMRDSNHNRLSKKERFMWLAHHCNLLGRLEVFIGSYSYKTKNNKRKQSFSLEQQKIINYQTIKVEYDEREADFLIKYIPGEWFLKFCDNTGEFLNQFGYIHQDILAKKLSIGLALPHKLRQHQSGDWLIENILKDFGFIEKLNAILTEKNSKKKSDLKYGLFKEFHLEIEKLKNLSEYPYKIEYRNPPLWLINPDEKKPRGWFNQWLKIVIVISEPDGLRAIESKENREQKKTTKKITAPELPPKNEFTVNQLKEAMTIHKVGIRKLADYYGTNFSWLQRAMKNNKLSQSQLKELINAVETFLKK